MNWTRLTFILCASVAFSLHASAANGSVVKPLETTKDSLKVQQQVKFQNLMFFSLPKAVDPIERKETLKKEEEQSSTI